MDEVSHKQIYDRLVAVESKVDKIDSQTVEVVSAFENAKGAFIALDWLARFSGAYQMSNGLEKYLSDTLDANDMGLSKYYCPVCKRNLPVLAGVITHDKIPHGGVTSCPLPFEKTV